MGLPLDRVIDHTITLKEGATPMILRPYRDPVPQKDIIELMVGKMITSTVIQSICNPFASLVLLMKNKDNSWRMCVDYWWLNDLTIQDKFPIQLIDEFLDELRGLSIFQDQFDLRLSPNSYGTQNCIPMHKEHYEFRVKPFGFTNSSTTFQSLMNTLLKPYLRKFVLAFFDDIGL